MPELPEVETTRRGITPFILQQKIKEMVVRNKQLRWEIPAHLKDEVVGKKIIGVHRRGKYLLLETRSGIIMIHLGMSGKLSVLSQDLPPTKHDHVDFVFQNGICLRYTDPRKFGSILWVEKGQAHPLIRDIGPEPLNKEFNADYFFEKTRNKKVSIKNFLMNAKNVAGVGNIYAVEALFLSSISPTRSAKRLSLDECKKLVAAVKKVLQLAIKKGGTTLRNFSQSDGNPGYFVQKLNVYGRGGLPCKRCQNTLKETRQGQRSTVFCKFCQR